MAGEESILFIARRLCVSVIKFAGFGNREQKQKKLKMFHKTQTNQLKPFSVFSVFLMEWWAVNDDVELLEKMHFEKLHLLETKLKRKALIIYNNRSYFLKVSDLKFLCKTSNTIPDEKMFTQQIKF